MTTQQYSVVSEQTAKAISLLLYMNFSEKIKTLGFSKAEEAEAREIQSTLIRKLWDKVAFAQQESSLNSDSLQQIYTSFAGIDAPEYIRQHSYKTLNGFQVMTICAMAGEDCGKFILILTEL